MLKLEKRPRIPRPPLLPVVIAAAWCVLVVATVIVTAATGMEITTCHVFAATNFPCATCGGTRASLALLGGDLGAAFRHNPLITLTLVLGAAVAALRLFGGRQVVLDCGRGGWAALTLLLIVAVALNWYYVAAINPAY